MLKRQSSSLCPQEFGVADKVLESWLLSLNSIRNLCAHHARLWNRGMGNQPPAIPRAHKHPDWHRPVPILPDRIFGVLTVLHYMLRQVAPQSRWRDRLQKLFAKYPDVPIRFMGFPENWLASPLWAEPWTAPDAQPLDGSSCKLKQ